MSESVGGAEQFKALEARIQAAHGQILDPVAWLMDLDALKRDQLLPLVETQLAALPAPIGPQSRAPQRRSLERTAGWIEFLSGGEGERAFQAERVVWLRGGDDLTYLKRMATLGYAREAFDLARSLLAKGGRLRARKLKRFLRGEGMLDDETLSFLEMVDATMPLHAIETGLADVPAPLRPQAIFRTLERLEHASAELRFGVACLDGATQEGIDMVHRGDISASVVAERAKRADESARGLWLGLAARAAFYAGDDLGVVRYLRQAFQCEEKPWLDRDHIFEQGSESLRQMLLSIGLGKES